MISWPACPQWVPATKCLLTQFGYRLAPSCRAWPTLSSSQQVAPPGHSWFPGRRPPLCCLIRPFRFGPVPLTWLFPQLFTPCYKSKILFCLTFEILTDLWSEYHSYCHSLFLIEVYQLKTLIDFWLKSLLPGSGFGFYFSALLKPKCTGGRMLVLTWENA